MSPDPLLVLGKHGKNAEWIIRGSLPGVLGCHPGGGTVPPDLQCFSKRDFLSLGWAHGGNEAIPESFKYTVMEKAALFYANDDILTLDLT